MHGMIVVDGYARDDDQMEIHISLGQFITAVSHMEIFEISSM